MLKEVFLGSGNCCLKISKNLMIMKRERSSRGSHTLARFSPTIESASTPASRNFPATPSSPTLHVKVHCPSKSSSSSLKRSCRLSSKRSLSFTDDESSSFSCFELEPSSKSRWKPLGVNRRELNLDMTFPTGQTFRWTRTGPSQYTGAVDNYLFTLRQIDGGEVEYFLHNHLDACEFAAEVSLKDFLNLSISLQEMWKGFAEADTRFKALAPYMTGARLLRQDPLECLFQFICSSNNNIRRITHMVGFLSKFGRLLGTVDGVEFRAFPSLKNLAAVDERTLREAGFGYRAKYIVGAIISLNSKVPGGKEWLLSLRNLCLEKVIEELCTLPGVGPKVAACIALFSLDQHHAVPVDTHVWQIATKYITPELSGETLTLKLSESVAKAFVQRFGRYAGWAQTVLFISELSSHQALLPLELRAAKEKQKTTKKKKRAVASGED